MKLYFRLLTFLRPHIKTLIPTAIFMFLFAALSGLTLTMIVPLVNIVLVPHTANDTGAVTTDGAVHPADNWMVFLPGFARSKAEEWLHSSNQLQRAKNKCPARG
jgi:hypothetical protein